MAGRPRKPTPDEYEPVFAALTHPARRHLLITLNLSGGQLTAGEIAALFDHAWPTTTRHLQQLVEAGLVEHEREGRRQLYRINPRPLLTASEWLATFKTSIGKPPTRRKT